MPFNDEIDNEDSRSSPVSVGLLWVEHTRRPGDSRTSWRTSKDLKKRTRQKHLKNVWRTCWERRESAAGGLSLLHAEGRYVPKSDSTPLRQSQKRESTYLFSSQQINNNTLLWTKTLSVCLCLFAAQISRSLSPPLSLAFSVLLPWQIFVSSLLATSTCRQLLTQPEASCFPFFMGCEISLRLNPLHLWCTFFFFYQQRLQTEHANVRLQSYTSASLAATSDDCLSRFVLCFYRFWFSIFPTVTNFEKVRGMRTPCVSAWYPSNGPRWIPTSSIRASQVWYSECRPSIHKDLLFLLHLKDYFDQRGW